MILLSDVIKAGRKEVTPYVFAQEGFIPQISAPQEEPDIQEHKALEEAAMEQAVSQAENILNAAREEARRMYEESKAKGYEDGMEEGRQAGYEEAGEKQKEALESELMEMKAWFEDCIASMEREKKELLDKYMVDLKDIAVAIAEKVIRISLKTSSETIKLMILSATSGLRKREWARIHISKYNVDMMLEGDAGFLNTLSYLSDHVKVIKMGEEDGTCIVELPDEIIDLSVNTQMANIKELLENA